MAVDPKSRNHFSATSWGHGVLDVRNNIVETVYSSVNSDGALIPFTNGPTAISPICVSPVSPTTTKAISG